MLYKIFYSKKEYKSSEEYTVIQLFILNSYFFLCYVRFF